MKIRQNTRHWTTTTQGIEPTSRTARNGEIKERRKPGTFTDDQIPGFPRERTVDGVGLEVEGRDLFDFFDGITEADFRDLFGEFTR